ncbi:MAG: hypothetical protein ABSH22_02365 [Tepidisphaeraceae bacterium]
MARESQAGYFAGPVTIADAKGPRDLRNQIWTGKENCELPAIVETQARSVLLIEKLNIFKRLVEDQFHTKNGCFLACGDGYPTKACRRLLRQLHERLQVPFYVLADNDPAGYLFFFLMARGAARVQGTQKKAMAIPNAFFLGIRAGDAPRLGIGKSVQIGLCDAEIKQLNRLKESPWLRSNFQWQQEINELLTRESKLEVEALCSISTSFLSHSYLPEKLQAGGHLSL